MFELEGFSGVRKTKWKRLIPGMIYIGGLRINDIVPGELRDFPVLTHTLLSDLTDRYRLRPDKEVLVADIVPGYSARKISAQINEANEAIDKINRFRAEFFSEREKILRRLEVEIKPGGAQQGDPVHRRPRQLDCRTIS